MPPRPLDPKRRALLLAAAASPGLAAPAAALQAAPPDAQRVDVDLHLQLQVQVDHTAIWPGRDTRIWRYEGRVLKGDPLAWTRPGGGPLPVLRVRQGQRLRIDIHNTLPEDTTVHWHGLNVPAEADGQPRFPIAPGARSTVGFTVLDEPGTYWFHPHAHGRVGFQVYQGLAGLLLIEAPGAQPLAPLGADVPLVIQDRSFDAERQLAYMPHDLMGRMDSINGFLGDHVLVNGRRDAVIAVTAGRWRLRVLNGSNARIYKLAWSDGRPMRVASTGAGTLPQALERPYLTLAPAERREILVDFSGMAAGSELGLVNLDFEAGTVATTRGSGEDRLPLGTPFKVAAFRVSPKPASAAAAVPGTPAAPAIPAAAAAPAKPATSAPAAAWAAGLAQAVNHERPRRFVLDMNVAQFTINGRVMDGTRVADDEIVRLGTTELWEFENLTMIPHPMHVHNVQFRVVDRQASTGGLSMAGLGWRGLDGGLVDEGWHDTVLVMPGQRVRILVRFQNHAGLYLYHCHNLEHEDGGMMRYYRIA